ncbi:MAG TPA: FlgD immunoglobulin-like domain containing protein [Gaiellaceae bacterium]
MKRTGLIAVALVLLVGSAAAFAWTEKLKLEPARVSKPQFDRHFSPTCNCHRATSSLSFVLERGQRIDVSVVDVDGDHVATLASGQAEPAGRVRLAWDGRTDDGLIAPDGIYRLKVRLQAERRTILIPSTIHVDTSAPELRDVVVEGAQTGSGLVIRYASDETARPLLKLDGKIVFRGERRHPGNARLRWEGPLPPGSHEAVLVLVDQAGNRSQPSQPVTVGG